MSLHEFIAFLIFGDAIEWVRDDVTVSKVTYWEIFDRMFLVLLVVNDICTRKYHKYGMAISTNFKVRQNLELVPPAQAS